MMTPVRIHVSGISIGPFHQPMSEEFRAEFQELPHDREHRNDVEMLERRIRELEALLEIRTGQVRQLRERGMLRRMFNR